MALHLPWRVSQLYAQAIALPASSKVIGAGHQRTSPVEAPRYLTFLGPGCAAWPAGHERRASQDDPREAG
jgi:hypothetical protein